ncbi:vacuolar sorting-associated protein-like protein [Phaeosphaeria sp. MPI-PUGE-AT-0046c]|nr:vacuolar sorting-associated protein-like protein [Phaeosphaeria sp. MPI-PUGE-AT-0046c]
MPIVPFQYGDGQVPLREFLPSLHAPAATSPVDIPEYPSVAIHTSPTPIGATDAAPDASYEHNLPAIAISVDHPSHDQSGSRDSSSTAGVGRLSDHHKTQMKGKKPAAIAAAGTFFGLFSFSQIYQNILFERLTPWQEQQDETAWVASSKSWIDRWTGKIKTQTNGNKVNLTEFWHDAQEIPNDWPSQDREVPQYVLDYAPLIYLYSGEEYWPGDIAEHLIHTTPHLDYTPIQATSDHPDLKNLNDLNKWGPHVYLQSDDNVEDKPDWLGGETNIPNIPDGGEDDDNDGWSDSGRGNGHYVEDKEGEKSDWFHVGPGDEMERGGIRPATTSPGGPIPTDTPEGEELVDVEGAWQPELRNRRRQLMGKKVVGGRSDAPAVLVVVPKEDGVVDAFWFFFYSYNLGNAVFNIRFGNHVGDWEHTLVRFQHGEPKAVFFSEHAYGEAYTYEAVEKVGKRPIGFSATGTHAMYATAGVHPYSLPGGILHDVTDRGPLWDPVQNLYSFTYDYRTDRLLTSNLTPDAPVGWFYYAGHWGDKFYPLSDPRQYRFVGQYHYVNGPLGPRFKNLGRQEVCQGNSECILKKFLGDKSTSKIKRYPDVGRGEEMSEEDARRVFGAEYDSAS